MIHFDPVPEPPDFDEKARKPGANWLKKEPQHQPAPGLLVAFQRAA